jgi:RNA recognition motif-containing protein
LKGGYKYMSKRLFVGNLSWNVTSEELNKLFAEFGQVTSADVISDKFTGRSKGFAFVEMANDDEATKAIEALNNKMVDNREIVVNEARPREERPQRGRDDRRGGGGGGFRRDGERPGGGRRFGNSRGGSDRRSRY